jgi:triacylglycerol esterase/lipase EstA (alpha/beta hydrolase family)
VLTSLSAARRRFVLGGAALGLLAAAGTVLAVVLTRPDRITVLPVAPDRPGPVLLVPGYGGSQESLEPLADRIRATGRTANVVALPGGGTGDLSAQVQALNRAVDAALVAGAPSVDVVGYSAGGVVAGLWVARDDGAAKARRVVTLGSPLKGTTVAGSAVAFVPDACPVACHQLAPGSAEVQELATAHVGARLPWLSIWTTADQTVTPPDSARLDGAVDVALQAVCGGGPVSHGQLPVDPAVVALVLRGLSTAPLTAAGCPRGSGE